MSQSKANLLRAERIFSALALRWPDAKCELEFGNSFQLLLAVLLSAQTTDKAVNRALAPLFAEIPDFGAAELVKLGEARFREIIRSIGLAPTKASNSYRMAKQLLEAHGGQVPEEQQALEALPGVGRKTANVVRNVLFGHPTMPVDTHVARVSVRLGLAPRTFSREQIEARLLELVPKRFAVQAHHHLIFLGRYACAARAPKCEECPVLCECPSAADLMKPSSSKSAVTPRKPASRRPPVRLQANRSRDSRS